MIDWFITQGSTFFGDKAQGVFRLTVQAGGWVVPRSSSRLLARTRIHAHSHLHTHTHTYTHIHTFPSPCSACPSLCHVPSVDKTHPILSLSSTPHHDNLLIPTGQTLLIPPGWFHAVYTPQVRPPSTTLMDGWIDRMDELNCLCCTVRHL